MEIKHEIKHEDIIKSILATKVRDRKKWEHQFLMKHKYDNDVRRYLLSMSEFKKDIPSTLNAPKEALCVNCGHTRKEHIVMLRLGEDKCLWKLGGKFCDCKKFQQDTEDVKDIETARRCMNFKLIGCDNKSCLNESCPLHRVYNTQNTEGVKPVVYSEEWRKQSKGCGKMYCSICDRMDESHTAYCVRHQRSPHYICEESTLCPECQEQSEDAPNSQDAGVSKNNTAPDTSQQIKKELDKDYEK